MAQPLRRGDRHETLPIRVVGLVVAILLIGISGCASQTPAAQAPDTADDATAPTTTSSEQADDSPTGGAGSATTTLRACDLLAPDDLAKLNVTDDTSSSKPTTCRWHEESGLHEVGVTLSTDLTMDTIRSNQDVTPLPLGSRDAVQYPSGGDSCVVAIELPDSSLALVNGTAPGNADKSCKLAKKVAKAVEPNLP